jgi:putative cell wall-binding protein
MAAARFRALFSGALVAAIAAVALVALPTAVAAADPIEAPDPACPQDRAFVGVSIVKSVPFVEARKYAGATITGALPPGIVLQQDTPGYVSQYFTGTPTTAGTYDFDVVSYFLNSPTKTISCTMTVGDRLPAPSRIAGADRFDQAAQIAASRYATVDTVYLASGEVFPDALSAGSVAGVNDSPLLLTKSGEVPAATKAALTALAPENIVVVGGPATVQPAVLDSLAADFPGAEVVRIGGADRFAVSQALIRDEAFGVAMATDVYVASGATFPDALAATPAAVALGGPVLLVNGSASTLSAEESATLAGTGATSVHIAGGPASVSTGIQNALSASYAVTRAGGADRYAAAVAVNAEVFAGAGVGTVYLASGEVFPDALSAGPIAGATGSPILLAQPTCVPDAVLDAIVELDPESIVILGGEATLAAEVDHLKAC